MLERYATGWIIMEKKRIDVDGKTIFREVSNEQQSSCEIAMNAKGDYTFKVKVYSDDPGVLKEKLAEYHKIAIDEIGGSR